MSIHMMKGWIMNREQVIEVIPGFISGYNNEIDGISVLKIGDKQLSEMKYFDPEIEWFCVGWVYASLIQTTNSLERQLHTKRNNSGLIGLDNFKLFHRLSKWYDYSIEV